MTNSNYPAADGVLVHWKSGRKSAVTSEKDIARPELVSFTEPLYRRDAAKDQTINYTAAAEHLAVSVHGCHLVELSKQEQKNAHRWARSAINSGLGLK